MEIPDDNIDDIVKKTVGPDLWSKMAVWERASFFRKLREKLADSGKAIEANDKALDIHYRRHVEVTRRDIGSPPSFNVMTLADSLDKILKVIDELKRELDGQSHTVTIPGIMEQFSSALRTIHETATELGGKSQQAADELSALFPAMYRTPKVDQHSCARHWAAYSFDRARSGLTFLRLVFSLSHGLTWEQRDILINQHGLNAHGSRLRHASVEDMEWIANAVNKPDVVTHSSNAVVALHQNLLIDVPETDAEAKVINKVVEKLIGNIIAIATTNRRTWISADQALPVAFGEIARELGFSMYEVKEEGVRLLTRETENKKVLRRVPEGPFVMALRGYDSRNESVTAKAYWANVAPGRDGVLVVITRNNFGHVDLTRFKEGFCGLVLSRSSLGGLAGIRFIEPEKLFLVGDDRTEQLPLEPVFEASPAMSRAQEIISKLPGKEATSIADALDMEGRRNRLTTLKDSQVARARRALAGLSDDSEVNKLKREEIEVIARALAEIVSPRTRTVRKEARSVVRALKATRGLDAKIPFW